MSFEIDLSIFRDYDIRGTYPNQLNEDTFYILGRAISSYLQKKKIAVGYDCRTSSLPLFKALTAGILDQGVDVINLGLISTEIHYFASGFYRFDANIIISASHNPPEYNGVKIVTAGCVPLHGGYGLPEIKKIAKEQKFPNSKKKGKMEKISIINQWIEHALKFVDISKFRKRKVVVDAGNGMGGISWEKIIGRLPVQIIPLFFEPDGNFPNHLPDPLKPENLSFLEKAITSQKADIGIALDGDADRLFILDEKANVLSGTITTAILSKALLKKHGPAPVLYNVVCGKIVPETIKAYHGKPIRVRVGHSFIKQAMKGNNALFGGEHSGHFYFRDNFSAESSFIAGLTFLEYLSTENKKLSKIAAEFDKYASSGEINFKIASHREIFGYLEKKFKDAISIDHVDGLSIWYSNWWFNIRVSKTEPLIRLNLEADDLNILKTSLEKVKQAIMLFGGQKA